MANIKINVEVAAKVNKEIDRQLDQLDSKLSKIQTGANQGGYAKYLKEDIQSAKDEVAGLRNEMKQTIKDFAAQKLDTDKFNEQIKSMKSMISELQSRVTNAEQSITKLTSAFKAGAHSKAFESRLNNMQQQINDFTNDTNKAISTLKTFNEMVESSSKGTVKKDPSKDTVEQEVTSFQFKKGGIKVPIKIDEKQLSKLQNNYNEIVGKLQEYAKKHPVDVTMRLFPLNTTKASAKEVKDAVRDVQAQIANLPEGDLKNEMTALYNNLEKEYQKALRLNIDVRLSEDKQSIKARIKELSDAVKEQGFVVTPKFDISDEDADAISAKLSELQEKITLKATSQIKLMSDSLTNLFSTADVQKWTDNFVKGLNEIRATLMSVIPLMQQLNGVNPQKNSDKKNTPDEKDVSVLIEFTNAMKALQQSLKQQQNMEITIDVEPLMEQLEVLKATIVMVHSGIGNLQSTLSNVKNTGGLQLILETLEKIENVISQIDTSKEFIKLKVDDSVDINSLINDIQSKVNDSDNKIEVPITVMESSIDDFIKDIQSLINIKLGNGNIGDTLPSSTDSKIDEDLNNRVETLKANLNTIWKSWINFGKGATQGTNAAVKGLNQVLAKLGDLSVKLGNLSDAFGGLDFTDKIGDVQNLIFHSGRSDSDIGEIIAQMMEADEIMKRAGRELRERGFYYNLKNGKHTNTYTFDQHGSYGLKKDLLQGDKISNYDTHVHTHPDLNASMSLPHIRKGELRGGDLLSFYSDYLKGIRTQIIAAQKEVEIFDAKKFYDKYGAKFKTNPTKLMTEMADVFKQVRADFKSNVLNYIEAFEKSGLNGLDLLLDKNKNNIFDLSSLESSKKNQKIIDIVSQAINNSKYKKQMEDGSIINDYFAAIKKNPKETTFRGFFGNIIKDGLLKSGKQDISNDPDIKKGISDYLVQVQEIFNKNIKSKTFQTAYGMMMPEILKRSGFKDFNESDYITKMPIEEFRKKYSGIAEVSDTDVIQSSNESSQNIEKETQAMAELYNKALESAEAKEKFAKANKKVLDSITTSLSGLTSEGGEFEKLGTHINNINSIINSIQSNWEQFSQSINTGSEKAQEGIVGIINKLEELSWALQSISSQFNGIDFSKQINDINGLINPNIGGVVPTQAIDQELRQTEQQATNTTDAMSEGAKEVASNLHLITDELGNIKTFYRGMQDSMGTGLVAERFNGATFWTDSFDLAKEYSNWTKVESAQLGMIRPLEIEGNGANWNNIEYLGHGVDEVSKKIIAAKKKIEEELGDLIHYAPKEGYHIEDITTDFAMSEFHRYMEEQWFGKEGYDEYLIQEMRDKVSAVEEAWAEYKAISDDMSNVYGRHNTKEFVAMAQESGQFDGVIFKNIVDSASGVVRDATNVVVQFNEDQIKFLETISASQHLNERDISGITQNYAELLRTLEQYKKWDEKNLSGFGHHKYEEEIAEFEKYKEQYETILPVLTKYQDKLLEIKQAEIDRDSVSVPEKRQQQVKQMILSDLKKLQEQEDLTSEMINKQFAGDIYDLDTIRQILDVLRAEETTTEDLVSLSSQLYEQEFKRYDINREIRKQKNQQVKDFSKEIYKDWNKSDEFAIPSVEEIQTAITEFQTALDERFPFQHHVKWDDKLREQYKNGKITREQIEEQYEDKFQQAFGNVFNLFPDIDPDDVERYFGVGILNAFDSISEASEVLHDALVHNLDIEPIMQKALSSRALEVYLDDLELMKKWYADDPTYEDGSRHLHDIQKKITDPEKYDLYNPEDVETYKRKVEEVIPYLEKAYELSYGKPMTYSDRQTAILNQLGDEELALEEVIKLWQELNIQAEKGTLLSGNKTVSPTLVGDLDHVYFEGLKVNASKKPDTILHSHANGMGTFSDEDFQLLVDNWDIGIRKMLLLVNDEIQKIDFSSLTKEQAMRLTQEYSDAFSTNMAKIPNAYNDDDIFSKVKMDTMIPLLAKYGLKLETGLGNTDNQNVISKQIDDSINKADVLYNKILKIIEMLHNPEFNEIGGENAILFNSKTKESNESIGVKGFTPEVSNGHNGDYNIHTHPWGDTTFSEGDLNQFVRDIKRGITHQLLASINGLLDLDLSKVAPENLDSVIEEYEEARREVIDNAINSLTLKDSYTDEDEFMEMLRTKYTTMFDEKYSNISPLLSLGTDVYEALSKQKDEILSNILEQAKMKIGNFETNDTWYKQIEREIDASFTNIILAHLQTLQLGEAKNPGLPAVLKDQTIREFGKFFNMSYALGDEVELESVFNYKREHDPEYAKKIQGMINAKLRELIEPLGGILTEIDSVDMQSYLQNLVLGKTDSTKAFLSKAKAREQLLAEFEKMSKKSADKLIDENFQKNEKGRFQIEQAALDELIASLKEKKQLEESTSNTIKSADNINTESKAFDELKQSAEKAAEAKEKFLSANNEVLQSIISSLSGLNSEGDGFNNINKIINNLTRNKDDRITNLIDNLEKIRDILSKPIDDDSFIKAIKDIADQGDNLKDLATILRAGREAVEQAKKQADNTPPISPIDSTKKNVINTNWDRKYDDEGNVVSDIRKFKIRNQHGRTTEYTERSDPRTGDISYEIKEYTDYQKAINDTSNALVRQARIEHDLTIERQKGNQDVDRIRELENEWQALERVIVAAGDAINYFEQHSEHFHNDPLFGSNVDYVTDFENQVNEKIAPKIAKENARYAGQVTKRRESLSKQIGQDLFTAQFELDNGEHTDAFNQRLRDIIDNLNQINLIIQNTPDLITEHTVELANQYNESLKQLNKEGKLSANKKANENSLQKNLSQVNSILSENTKGSFKRTDVYAKLVNLQRSFKSFDTNRPQQELAQLTSALLRTKAEFEDLDNTVKGKNLFQTFIERLHGTTAQLVAQYMSWMDIIRYLRTMATTIIDLDTQLVDLRKTTTMSTSELNEFYIASSNVAKQLGVTTSEIISQAAAWSRLGYSSQEEATRMAEISSKFASISPGMTTDQSTDYLVSTMQAYGIAVDDVQRKILDNVNRIGNTFATTNAEIGEMLTRSSAAMKAANNSLEETIALESAAVEITRNAETTGTAFRTVSMRIRGLDEETEESLENYEELKGKIADLTKTDKTPGGVSLFTDASKTQYKSTYQFLKDIAAVWDDINDKDQAALLETIGGKRGAQSLAGILSDFSEVERAMSEMEDAAGAADAEMGIIEDSLEFKLNALKQEWVQTLQEVTDRGEIGDWIERLTKVSEALGWVIDKLGLFKTAAIGVAAIWGSQNLGYYNDRLRYRPVPRLTNRG